MNCTICGKGTSHGALLCRPCKAALKRARLLTVQDLPRLGRRATAKAALRDAPVEPSDRANARRRSGKLDQAGRLLLGAAAIAALAGAAFVAEREIAGQAVVRWAPAPLHAESRAPDPTPVIDMAAREATVAPIPPPTTIPGVAPVRERQHVGTFAPVRPASTIAANAPAAPLRVASEAREQRAAIAPPAAYPALDSFGPVAEAPRPAPPPVVVPRAPPPPPDRWQVMSDALGRCANEGGLSGFICDQRVRLASCDGYWGRVAQCPNPPENPR